MTDKEQIIIDGVDVSKCEFYMHYDYGKFSHGCSLYKDMFGLPVCCDIADCCKDCYFKQLARKTQECESLKEEIEVLKDNFDTATRDCNELIEELKQECEELKKEIINKDEKIKELRFSVSDLTNRLCFLNGEKSFRIVDLEQALDEIAAHYQKVIKNITNYDDSYDASISIKALHNISDIINKAKGR